MSPVCMFVVYWLPDALAVYWVSAKTTRISFLTPLDLRDHTPARHLIVTWADELTHPPQDYVNPSGGEIANMIINRPY